ncbi:MAG: acyltransferase [Eubacterium sp.]|nr:acyltransferase [Eubacterium sp.]
MRKHYIDNLRWITILMLIPYHIAMAWNTWGEPNYIYFETNRFISSIIVFLSPYFMPLLFLLAGISTSFALQKRTAKQYVIERLKKLFIPFVFGTLILMPIMTFIADRFNFGYAGNLFQHYSVFFTKFTDLTGADGGFSIGQFWFILYLFVVSIVSLGIIALQKKYFQKKKDIPLWLICILGLLLPILNNLLSIGGKSLVEYTYIFLIGYFVFSNDSIISKIEKYRLFFFLVGLTATILNVYLFIWADSQYLLLNTIAKFVSEWFMLIALLGIGKRYLNKDSKISKYISQRSFAFYIMHFIWVVLFQYLMFNVFKSNIVLLYIVPLISAYIATFLSCEICVRVPFLCSIMGLKCIKTKR